MNVEIPQNAGLFRTMTIEKGVGHPCSNSKTLAAPSLPWGYLPRMVTDAYPWQVPKSGAYGTSTGSWDLTDCDKVSCPFLQHSCMSLNCSEKQ